MNPLLHAAEKGSAAERWHPQPMLKAALAQLGRIARDSARAMPKDAIFHIEKAQDVLHKGRSMLDMAEAAAEVMEAAAACHHANLATVARELDELRKHMADARIHMRDRARPDRIMESAGFCSRCWRITDNMRGDKYLCVLHAGGSDSATAKAADRLMKNKGERILATEAQLLVELGHLPVRAEKDWKSHPKLTEMLTACFNGDDVQIVGRYQPAEFETAVIPEVRQRRQMDERAAVYSDEAEPSGQYVDLSRAYAKADTDVPERAALRLARDGLGAPMFDARATQTALLRIAADQYYVARVLARAEAFLRFMPKSRAKAA